MVRLLFYIGAVALAIGAGFVLVTDRAALTRTGYRVAQMELERRELTEQNRRLDARVARLRTAAHIAERAAALHLELLPPEDSYKDRLPPAPKKR